ncbi:MAB_1171c family putative transporter [Streptomyces milbemycinicus]|uniref:MAB_1171c family putative transporter n=1 Tax=Streptomyces milbemycinicus TaxID=476552 RepID=A0ABW8LD62_9ACTN
MFDVVYLCFGAAAWAIVGYKARAWFRDRQNADLGLTCVMTAGVANVFLLSAPSVYRWFDHLVGVANLAMVFLYSSVVVFATGALVLMLRWTGSAVRPRTVVTAVGAAWSVAVVGFAVGRPDAVEHPRDFSTAYADAPGVVTFLVLYLAIFGSGLAGLGVLCRRYASTLRGSWLARGLRVLAAGCWLGLAYCACKVIGFLFSWAGRDLPWLSNGVAPLTASVAALLVLAGFAIPALGPRVSAWRRLRRLNPLWREVTAQAPEVAMAAYMGHHIWTGWWPFADLEWRANRQMAEIRDVQRGVRRHVEAEALEIARVKGRTAGLGDWQLVAFMEAAALRRGLLNQAAGRVPVPGADSVVVETGAGPGQEHEHLARVADVYHQPLVDEVLAELGGRTAAQRQ